MKDWDVSRISWGRKPNRNKNSKSREQASIDGEEEGKDRRSCKESVNNRCES